MDWLKKIEETVNKHIIVKGDDITVNQKSLAQEIADQSYPKPFVRWLEFGSHPFVKWIDDIGDFYTDEVSPQRFTLDELFHYYETEVTK